MTKDYLKLNYPQVYNEILNEGIQKERKRFLLENDSKNNSKLKL